MKLSDYKALTFDVYGTLIDWETGMVNGLKPLSDRRGGVDRNELLEAHAYHESTSQRWTPAKKYSDILATVYKRIAQEWKLDVTWAECEVYGRSVEHWPAFPDSAESLAYLRQHYTLVALTNVDNTSFAFSDAKLGEAFHFTYVAEDIGSYKPSDRNFDYMLEDLARQGIEKADILHTAESMFHDHGPANRYDLANCWIYRRHDQEGFGATMHPGDMPKVDFTFTSMAELVEAHKAEVGA